MKTLLVIGCGTESLPALARARAMGLYLIGTDGNPGAPGFAYCDEHRVVSTYDVDATVSAACEYARDHPIHGVIALAADVPVTVASVAEALGLPGIPVAAARLCSDKLLQKAHLQAAGIPVPWFAPVQSGDHLALLHAACRFPLVLKPVDSRGARGVIRMLRDVDPHWAFKHAQAYSPTRRVMVEEWLSGAQISTETVLHDGWSVTLPLVDRNYSRLDEFAPYCVEDGGDHCSILAPHDQQAVALLVEQAARALNIHEGTAKGDVVFGKNGPVLIEMACRLSGGYLSSIQYPCASGIDIIGIAISLVLGVSVTQEACMPLWRKGCSIRYVFPARGRVTAIRNVEAVRDWNAVCHVDVPAKIGDEVGRVTDHTRRVGSVIAMGATRADAVALARDAVAAIQIETEDAPDA